tara:strand:+ start:37227 stop:37901 length:675 start_codon:yes stop_codon:yes gene_type:complete
MKKKITLAVSLIIFAISLTFLISNWKSCSLQTVDQKTQLILELKDRVFSLEQENKAYQTETTGALEMEGYYKEKYHDFAKFDTIFEYVYFSCDSVIITKEIENKINQSLQNENELLKLTILQNRSKEISNLAAISHEFTEKTANYVFRKPETRYKLSILAGYGFRSDLSDFKPVQVYNVGLGYSVNKRLGVGLMGDFAPRGLKKYSSENNSIGISLFLKYNFNN